MINFQDRANDIWSIANLLRGLYKQHDYGKVILPFTILRRLDELLEPTKEAVLVEAGKIAQLEKEDKTKTKNYNELRELKLNKISGYRFHNRSKFTLKKLVADASNLQPNLRNYINGFSIQGREIFEYFEFDKQIAKLDEGKGDSNLLYLVAKEFSLKSYKDLDTLGMGYVFEHLIRKFAEASNETAGEHFTPREIIELMVNILFVEDSKALTKEGIVRTMYDPACGTGGMLSVAEMHLKGMNEKARLELFGQEINPESYAICKSEMLIKGQNPSQIKFGNTFTTDGLEKEKFDYMLSNPPFGVEWKKEEKVIKAEYEKLGFAGRFGPGLPRINDGSLLFLLHMMSKMKDETTGTRIGIIFNGSQLFNGGAGSGESEIRKWIIEKDYLETIIALPDQLFYNTGISTYLWIVTNRKSANRQGKVQLINATSYFKDGSSKDSVRSLGSKRKFISPEQIEEITKIYGEFEESKVCKVFDNDDFAYHRITVDRPKKDEQGNILKDKKGNPLADTDFRDNENVPFKESIEEYFKREVLPHVPDAWIDHSKTKVGYEINMTKYFYEFKPLRSLEEIRLDIMKLEEETEGLIQTVIK